MAKLVKFTLLTRDVSEYLTDSYSERKTQPKYLRKRLNLGQAV